MFWDPRTFHVEPQPSAHKAMIAGILAPFVFLALCVYFGL